MPNATRNEIVDNMVEYLKTKLIEFQRDPYHPQYENCLIAALNRCYSEGQAEGETNPR